MKKQSRLPAKTLRKPSQLTADSLQNVITGLGTARSKRSYTGFTYDQMNGYGELEAAYQSNWLASAIVDYPADDMTREWRAIKCKDADDIRAEEDRLCISHAVNDAVTWSRLYGGSAILMLTNQDFEKPLDVSRIKQGDLSRLLVLDRYQLYPQTINTWNILADNYMQPEFWQVWQGSQRIHHSHFVFFRGKKVPNRLRMQTLGWGDSELRRCMEELKDAMSSKGGIAELMQEANLDVITAQGLADNITTGQEQRITDRYTQYGLMKSIFKLSLLDGDEKLDRMTLNLSGVAPVLETLKSFVIGASKIPATRLFGEQAKGLGNEGAGDLNNYYDNIRAQQVTYLDPAMSYLDQVMVRSAIGMMPADYNFDWNRLYQPNRKEEAEARKIEAETSILYLDAGVIQRSQVMRNLESDEQYHYPDGVIDEMEQAEESNWRADDLSQAEQEFNRQSTEVLGREVADSWSEEDHPRDDEGKFSSTSGGGSKGKTSNSNTKSDNGSSETQKGSLSEAEESGFDTSDVYSHFTNNPSLDTIKKSGNFPGVFALPESNGGASAYGRNEYKFVVKGGVAESSDIKDFIGDNYEKSESFVKSIARSDVDDDLAEQLLDIASGESMESTEELMDALGAIDDADFFKEAQSLRMKFASFMGKGAVRMEDEFGTDTVALLPGDKVMMIK